MELSLLLIILTPVGIQTRPLHHWYVPKLHCWIFTTSGDDKIKEVFVVMFGVSQVSHIPRFCDPQVRPYT